MRLFDTFGIPALAVAAVSALAGPSWAQCPGADTFEDNDDCLTAAPLTNGTYTGLTVQGQADVNGVDDDFYSVTLPVGEILTVDCLFIDAVADVDVYFYDSTAPNCGGEAAGDYLVRGFTGTDNEHVVYANPNPAPMTIIVRVEMFTTTVDCNDYDLVVSTAPDPCATPTDDSFEENDACGTFSALPAGATAGLFVSETDWDYYTISVPAGDILTVDMTYGGGSADVDMRLYDDLACTNQVDSVFPTGGSGQVEGTNGTAGAATFVLAVEVVAGAGCNTYDLNVTTAPDPCIAGGDDTFEDNDDCGTAAVLPSGSTTGLRIFGAASAIDDDYYVIQGVPTGMILTVDVLFIDANGDIDCNLYDDPACSNQVDGGFTTSDNEQVTAANGSGVAQDYYLRVYAFGSSHDCSDYDLLVTIAPDPCAVAIDDSFEDNDDCASAVALASGTHTGLFASETDHDYYTISVPAGEILTVDVTYVSGANGDIDMYVFDDLACTNQVDVNFSFGGAGQVTWSNATGATATAVLSCRVATGEGCNNYDLNVATAPDPCLNPAADDAFEDNDDCSTATPMADGTTTGLFVSKVDHDYYEFVVADGDTLNIDILFSDALGDLDMELYLDNADCLSDINVDGSFSVSDNENVSYTNTSGGLITMYLHVYHYQFDSSAECNVYDMVVTGSGGSASTPFCFGDGTADAGSGPVFCPCANESAVGAGEGCQSSLGFGAVLTSSGTSVVANDDMVFTLSQARPNQPSLLVQGTNVIAVPFKDGVLCMGNPTERLEVVFLDGTGTGSTTVSIVTEGNITPGDTRYYQQWFRDPGGVSPCGSGSNFSQGLIVVWN